MEKTLPIRWVCPRCHKVVRLPLMLETISTNSWRGGLFAKGEWVLRLPRCKRCDRLLLLAGEPKRDTHGLRELDTIIDPVDNLRKGHSHGD